MKRLDSLAIGATTRITFSDSETLCINLHLVNDVVVVSSWETKVEKDWGG